VQNLKGQFCDIKLSLTTSVLTYAGFRAADAVYRPSIALAGNNAKYATIMVLVDYVSDWGVDARKYRSLMGVNSYEKIMAFVWLGRYNRSLIVPARRDIDGILKVT